MILWMGRRKLGYYFFHIEKHIPYTGLVKRLPPVSRCIVDAGVCVGLTIGATSIFYHFMSAMVTGKLPGVDACIPRREKLN